MSIIGIICEYNPPHNGHAYQISELRRRFPDAVIVCAMSGCFVQRGTPAIIAPGARARAATALGADVVVELPPAYALAPAELFARGGVSLLAALGVDVLCFGAETVSDSNSPAEPLCSAADNLDNDAFRTSLALAQKYPENAALGYPVLREEVYRLLFGDSAADVLRTPNNILGIEYIRAIRHIGAAITPLALRRVGADHDAPLSPNHTQIASATAIRDCLYQGEDSRAAAYLPNTSAAILAEETLRGRITRNYESILGALLLSYYRTTPDEMTAQYAGLSGGLAARLYKASVQSASLADFYSHAAAKNLTAAAIRRAALCGYFQITLSEQKAAPPYIRLLARAAGDGASALLRRAAKSCPIPLITRPASYKALPPQVRTAFERDLRIAETWGMLCEIPVSAADWLRYTL